MKKTIIIWIHLAFCVSFCFGQTSDLLGENIADLHLIGKVKMVKVSYFDTQNNYKKLDSIVKGNIKHTFYLKPESEKTYDIHGNLIVENKKDYKGKTKSKIIYSYENQKLIEKKEVYPNDSIVNKAIYKYGLDGNLLEEFKVDKNSFSLLKKRYVYNKNGQKTKYLSYNLKGVVGLEINYNYKYNQERYSQEMIIDGKINSIKKYIKNQLREKIYLNKNEKISGKRTYEYDDKGNLLTEESFSPSGNLIHQYNYKFDNRNNTTLFEHYKNSEVVTKWKYEYTQFDIQGNWLQRINFLDMDKGYWYIEERKIEYYE